MASIPEAKSSALAEQRSTCVQETWPAVAPHKPPSIKQNPEKGLISPVFPNMVCGYVKGLGSPRRNPGGMPAAVTNVTVLQVWFILAHL